MRIGKCASLCLNLDFVPKTIENFLIFGCHTNVVEKAIVQRFNDISPWFDGLFLFFWLFPKIIALIKPAKSQIIIIPFIQIFIVIIRTQWESDK